MELESELLPLPSSRIAFLFFYHSCNWISTLTALDETVSELRCACKCTKKIGRLNIWTKKKLKLGENMCFKAILEQEMSQSA